MADQDKADSEKRSKGAGSFCVPRTAIQALLDAKADAYTICAYLTLACYTDESGTYSTASAKAIQTATGANKMTGGPIPRAIQRLKEIHAFKRELVSNGKAGNKHGWIEHKTDLGPILFDRDTWLQQTGEVVPDGPTARGKILHILPTFSEPAVSRVWFGRGLVEGFETHKKPLKQVKDAGDVPARLLLSMYAANDMETWGGVCPVGHESVPWGRYEPVSVPVVLPNGATLIRAKRGGEIAAIAPNVSGGDDAAYWQALEVLQSIGLIYEVVLVLNRNAEMRKFASGDTYSGIPADAEPLYELDCRSQHGYKPKGEEGLGGITALTAGDRGYPVATHGGQFDGTYAAIVRRGQGAMIAGIYRLRYRVSNLKNAGIKSTWSRIYENNRDHYAFIASLRAAYGLPVIPAPWEAEASIKAGTEAKEGRKRESL